MGLKHCPQWAKCAKPVSQCYTCAELAECAGCGVKTEMADMDRVEFESDVGRREGLLCSICRRTK